MKNEQVFCDAIGMISATGGVIRMDFVSLSPTERDASGNPKTEFCHRLIMPLEGFLPFATKLQETVQALARRGVVRLQPPATPPADSANDGAGALPEAVEQSPPEPIKTRQAPGAAEPPPSRPFP